MDKEDYQKIRDYCLKLLALRPRSEKEIKDKALEFATSKRITISCVKDVLENLSSENLINDREFCRWWIDQRSSFRPKGIRVIKMELLSKGIDKEIINEVLSGAEKPDEFRMAIKVVNKKINLYKKLSGYKFKSKISELLYRRGFNWDIIKQVVDSVVKKS